MSAAEYAALANATVEGSPGDVLQDALPSFTYSMPIQILVLGVTLTLTSVLLVHLLFTVRYHLPLSRLNYFFQVTAVTFTLASNLAELNILCQSLIASSNDYPYTFLFIEVPLPPEDWSQGGLGGWLVLQGMVSLSIHATHIQFLTLLFPSGLEAKLILGLLGPLAIASAFLSFVDLSTIPTAVDLGDAIRDTCNSSLTLLYTIAIFLWGLTLNRERAWRSDGGTAAFGILALFLGTCGTIINFLEVKEERLRWMAGIVNCILLWQSWVSLWWWVGAGMWAGEAEEVEKTRKQIARKLEARRIKQERREAIVARGEESLGSRTGVRELTGAVRRRMTSGLSTTATRTSHPEEIELQDLRIHPRPSTSNIRRQHSSDSSASVTSSTPSPPSRSRNILSFLSPILKTLRSAHDEGVVQQASTPNQVREATRANFGIRAVMIPPRARGAGEEENGRRTGGEDEHRLEEGRRGRNAGVRETDEEVRGREEDWVDETHGEERDRGDPRSGWSNAVRRWRLKDVSTY